MQGTVQTPQSAPTVLQVAKDRVLQVVGLDPLPQLAEGLEYHLHTTCCSLRGEGEVEDVGGGLHA